ncbi:MAG: sigma-54-dependent Fis family transcriptional regulator [Porticoccaceae bacterium]|nr:sigma-54-dependent Fis family transcriptional regulator [Porticoccaceae bacterium]MBT6115680.1 sigma-54-dependent Fis family transcriptional regulator [Porticoccaceae bacterium]MDG1495929.1 sigma-54 dependent transcriptional regulator [Porticoccaceae bacterium]
MTDHKMIDVIWFDSNRPLSPTEVTTFAEQGLAITQADITEPANTALFSAQLIVVTLSQSTEELKELQSHLAAANSSAPIIARVDRSNFELGIGAMREGALTVISQGAFNADEWAEVLELAQCQPVKNNSQQAFVFADPVSRNLLALAERVAEVDVTVLVTGPTGAGKEVLARILHDASARHQGPFVAFNCAAMPENLIEDMLFGHEKGSFTGASKVQPGLFEQAQGGTVFLDEIGEMSFHLQAKLLRILQERSVVRLGGQKAIDLNIRVIAATNRDLKAAIAQQTFREDLYFRLTAFKLAIPSLSERPKDILPLAEQFLSQQGGGIQTLRLTRAAQLSLESYRWPGNVRELQNVLVRGMVLANGAPIDVQHLLFDDIQLADSFDSRPSQPQENPFAQYASSRTAPAKDSSAVWAIPQASTEGLNETVKHSEWQAIMNALSGTRSREHAAEQLGISPRTLRHKLQRLREQGINVTRAYAR